MQQYADPSGAGLGSVYTKALYREYTDASFSTRKKSDPQHGILGPILHAHIGDTLNIVFRVRHGSTYGCTPIVPVWMCWQLGLSLLLRAAWEQQRREMYCHRASRTCSCLAVH